MFDLKKTGATENVAVPVRGDTVDCLSTEIEKPRCRRGVLAVGGSLAGLSLVEALCAGIREDGSVIEPNDPGWSGPGAAAGAARRRPSAWLEQRDIHRSLVEEPGFAEAIEEWLDVTWSEGAATAPGQNLRDV
ncbi:MAG: hypothetical protein OXH79_22690 [Boseongicola sp.]|nr:hypothetical protein [Boseongicola sp.]